MSDILTVFKEDLILLDREILEDKIGHLYPKKYNKFQWWRRYQEVQELDEKAPMGLKILNGDYDYPSYFYEAQHEVYRMYDEVKDMKMNEDRVDRINLYMERYRRLMEDAYKEENRRMDEFKKRLTKAFKITLKDLEEMMSNFDGTLEELYYQLQKTNKK